MLYFIPLIIPDIKVHTARNRELKLHCSYKQETTELDYTSWHLRDDTTCTNKSKFFRRIIV